MEEIDSLPVGSRIEVTLRPGNAVEFAKKDKVVEVINKYSYFITLPITVNGERVNTVDAIWTMNPKEVTSEMHETFFRQLAKTHSPHLVNDRPQYTIHYKVTQIYSISLYFLLNLIHNIYLTHKLFFCKCSFHQCIHTKTTPVHWARVCITY